MRGDFQIGRFSTLGDRFEDFRREKRQSDEAGNVAISHALAAECEIYIKSLLART